MKQEGKQFQRTEDGHLILMTPEERKLLITDLTSRIEYGVICMIERVDDFGPRWRNEKLTGFCNEEGGYFYFDFCYGLAVDFAEKVKPYLRPMSSMTEEEMDRLFDILQIDKDGKDEDWIKINDVYGIKFFFPTGKWIENVAEAYDYLYSIHIDFRGLIHKGLAIEAPEGMYNLNCNK